MLKALYSQHNYTIVVYGKVGLWFRSFSFVHLCNVYCHGYSSCTLYLNLDSYNSDLFDVQII